MYGRSHYARKGTVGASFCIIHHDDTGAGLSPRWYATLMVQNPAIPSIVDGKMNADVLHTETHLLMEDADNAVNVWGLVGALIEAEAIPTRHMDAAALWSFGKDFAEMGLEAFDQWCLVRPDAADIEKIEVRSDVIADAFRNSVGLYDEDGGLSN